jgi:hypothetical protein
LLLIYLVQEYKNIPEAGTKYPKELILTVKFQKR